MAIRALDLLMSRPWLIQPEALQNMLAIAAREGDLQEAEIRRVAHLEQQQALIARGGSPMKGTDFVSVREGIAIIDIRGPIFARANLFTEISGAVSTERLARELAMVMEAGNVRGVLIAMDSPGGEVPGINEMAETIYAARERMPVYCYVGALAASAGYWLASAASKVYANETALLGSIGVIMSFVDRTKQEEKADWRKVEIVSSASPKKNLDPRTPQGRAEVQALCDQTAEIFIGKVAAYRGVDSARVITDFGAGGVMLGKPALAAGMIDGLGSFESTFAELAGIANKHMWSSYNMSRVQIATTAALMAALASGTKPDQIDVVPDTSAWLPRSDAVLRVDAQRERDTAVAAATESAAKGERARIAQIQTLTEAGFETLTTAAIEDGRSAAQFALDLQLERKNRGGNTLARARADASQPLPRGQAPKPGEPQGPKASDVWADAVKAHNEGMQRTG